jgi:hypothetical protein
MATSVTNTTFNSVYHDDYVDSDNYHRILFNSGRALQARELTQMQTIIQKEIARLGNYLFKQGAIINASGGSLAARELAIDYVVLSGWSGTAAEFQDLVGKYVENASGLVARVKAVLTSAEATAMTSISSLVTTPGYTLLVEYVDDNQTSTQTFAASQTLTPDASWSGTGTFNIGSSNGPIGRGSLIELPLLNMYANGFFLQAEKQLVVLDPYDSYPTEVVGYQLVEDIVNVSDNPALYDNSGATLNTTSPGADRYRIILTLTKESVMTASDTFIPVLTIKNGTTEAIITQDNQTNELGRLLAKRTYDISGDFISKNPNGTFACEIDDDSAAGFYRIRISPGVGFVSGYRVEKTEYTTLRIEKPRNAVNDIDTLTNESVLFSIGNYFLVDSIGGDPSNGSLITRLHNTIQLFDSADDDIGEAKMINLDKIYNGTDFDYKIHVADLDFYDSNGSGQLRNISDTRALGFSNTPYTSLKAVQGAYNLQDRSQTKLIFPLPRNRPKAAPSGAGTISANIQKINTNLTAGSNKITVTGTDTLANPEDWIVVDRDADTTIEGFTVSNLSGSTADISGGGITNGNDYDVLFYQQQTYTIGGRTYNNNVIGSSVSLTNGEYVIQNEITKINSITDDTTGEDIKYKFVVIKDINDTHIGTSRLVLRTEYSAPAGTISYDVDTFTNQTSNDRIYTVNSYGVDYNKIPGFRTRLGETFSLEDVVDLRYTKNTSNAYVKIAGLPKNNSLINVGEVEYWQPRVDRVYLSQDGNFKVLQGETDAVAKIPNLPQGAMSLTDIFLASYVKNKKDHLAVRTNNDGYKMSQIRSLEKRISNLETLTTLTMAELTTKELSVVDENGIDRYKLGLTVDKFDNNIQTAIAGIEQRAKINKNSGNVTPVIFWNTIEFKYDSDNSAYTIRKGDTVWPVYEEEEYLSQLTVSGPIYANSFTSRRFIGSGTLTPSHDTWDKSLKVNEIQGDTESARIATQGNQLESIDPYWKRLGYSSYRDFLAGNDLL